jgi:hypothetical protein
MHLRRILPIAIFTLLPFVAPAWVFAESEGGTDP